MGCLTGKTWILKRLKIKANKFKFDFTKMIILDTFKLILINFIKVNRYL